jgi:hypothetical protein
MMNITTAHSITTQRSPSFLPFSFSTKQFVPYILFETLEYEHSDTLVAFYLAASKTAVITALFAEVYQCTKQQFFHIRP